MVWFSLIQTYAANLVTAWTCIGHKQFRLLRSVYIVVFKYFYFQDPLNLLYIWWIILDIFLNLDRFALIQVLSRIIGWGLFWNVGVKRFLFPRGHKLIKCHGWVSFKILPCVSNCYCSDEVPGLSYSYNRSVIYSSSPSAKD